MESKSFFFPWLMWRTCHNSGGKVKWVGMPLLAMVDTKKQPKQKKKHKKQKRPNHWGDGLDETMTRVVFYIEIFAFCFGSFFQVSLQSQTNT